MFGFLWRYLFPRLGLPATVLLALAITLASGAELPVEARANAAPDQQSDGDHTPGRAAAWDTVDDAADGQPAPAAARVAAAATDCLGWPARRIRYTSDGVIHLEGCGQTFTLSDIPAAGIGADKLELVDPANKIWQLKVKLKVEEGATLRVSGGPNGDASWLRLRSDRTGGIWLRAENGNLLFQDTKVTSWDPAANAPDSDTTVAADGSGGRSYMATRSVLTRRRPTAAPTACDVGGGSQEPYEGRMSVVNSEIGYLGYDAAESYGMVWKVYYKVDPSDPSDSPPPGRQLYAMADVFGEASGSTFHHNYFGSYTYGGYCMTWAGNTFANNLEYGLDPHDDSDYLMIAGNTFRDNGNHGVICSVECDHLVIANNQSYRNLHGIMVHRNTNGALIEGNTSRDNRGAGIAIFDSHDTIVRNNTVANNGESAIRLSVGSSRNLIENNTLTGLAAGGSGPGYVVYAFKGNDPPTSGDGLPKDNTFRGNRLAGYKSPLMKLGQTTGNIFEANTIGGPATDITFSQATGNIVRDGELGASFRIALDASSSVTLQDTRNAVWLLSRSGLATTAGPNGSTRNLTFANAGPDVTVTTLDLAVRPQNGAITVLPSAWSASAWRWSESVSAASGPIAHRAGGLTAGACYDVTANGALIGSLRANASGHIAFSSSVQSGTVDFAIVSSSRCTAAAPAPAVWMPLVRR